MAYSIKQNQKRELKKLLNKSAASIRLATRPKVKPLGTLGPARLTVSTTVWDKQPKTRKKSVKRRKK